MKQCLHGAALALGVLLLACLASAQVAGTTAANDLAIVTDGKTQAIIAISPTAGLNEKLAAADLAKYIGLMTGATPQIATGTWIHRPDFPSFTVRMPWRGV